MAAMTANLTIPRPLTLNPSHSHIQFPRIQKLESPTFPAHKFPNSRVSLPVLRATIDVVSTIRPGGAVETNKLPPDVRKRAMAAIDSCNRRVTLGDVAIESGLSYKEAQIALQALAADSDGFLEVSDEGDVLYVFPVDYGAKLALKSFRIRSEPLVKKAKDAAEYLVRASFGTALIVSIILVFTSILLILCKSGKSKSSGSSGSSSSSKRWKSRSTRSSSHSKKSSSRYTESDSFALSFSPIHLIRYWDPNHYKRQRMRTEGSGTMNFIETVFSFVFGDGDPNHGLEEERWKMIGQYIASHGGVVTAEELAPYLDLKTKNTELTDESYILPVLLQFDGHPEKDEEGNILYRFPSLQRTASSQNTDRKTHIVFFKEKKWQFSKTNTTQRAIVVGLGAFNLLGVAILSGILRDPSVKSAMLIKFVEKILPLVKQYAGFFFTFPLIRLFINYGRNIGIEKRNKSREQFARALVCRDISLSQKLRSARAMANKTVIGRDRIVYSTDKDLVEQDYEAREWERRLVEVE